MAIQEVSIPTLRRLLSAAAGLLLASCLALADDAPQSQAIGPFSGLYTNVSQEAIPAQNSPDLLNVDLASGGRSVRKRAGYSLDTTLTVSTSPVHGAYHFFDASGNDVRLWFNDIKVTASVNGAAYTTVLATATRNATWSCADYLGSAYCLDSAFDMPIKTDGTSAGTSYQSTIPLGSLIAGTADRLLVGATAANPSRIYYSGSATFTDFTLGTQNSSSSFEDITAPGSKLTHLAYHYGRWLWWKDQSFGFVIGTGQTDLQIVTVSNTIGTLDDTDIYDQGLTYFRGTDTHVYAYDGNILKRLSTDITPTVKSAGRRKANSWAQTSQTDWQAGSIVQTGTLSTTISIGDVTVSSWTDTDATAANFALGSHSNTQAVGNSVKLATDNTGSITNPDFESAFSGNWTGSGCSQASSAHGPSGCTVTPESGSFLAACGSFAQLFVLDTNNNVLFTSTPTVQNDCVWRQTTVTDSADVGKRVKIRIGTSPSVALTTSDSYIFSGSLTYWAANTANTATNFDNVQNGSSTITSGTFTSRVFDTSFSTSIVNVTGYNTTINTETPSFVIQHSTASTGPWATLTTFATTNVQSNRYLRYQESFSVSSTQNALSTLDSVAIIARSTGTFYSAVNNAASLTSWNTFSVTDAANNGTITYYTRSALNPFTILSSTPSWVAQTKNASVSASTGTYFQARADFAIDAATQTPTLSDLTFSWFEGTAADKMYGTYFDNAIWFSVSLGTAAATNNRVLRYDLLNQAWMLYDIPVSGFLVYNNQLYFGDPTAGKTYLFGNVTSDNGSSINAYWKSKPFFGDSPFTDKDLRMASWYVAAASGTTLTMTYTLNETTSTVTKTVNLYDARKSVIQHNWNFPLGSIGTNFNIQFGDTSSNPAWEVFGGAVSFVPRPWKVYP